MKPHFKPLANHLQTAWRKAIILHFTFSILHSTFASVPLAWQVTPRNPAPVAFDRHHGETLEFRCVFSGFGELPFGQAADIRLWYQTNGMSAAWWSVPASVSSNVLSATFPPQADPGADRLSLFFGAPSNAYASAVLRLRHSPGFAPNILPPPEQATIEETDPVFAAWLAATELVHEEQDPTVPEWAKSPTPPASGLSTNDVCNIVTNEVVEFTAWEKNDGGDGWDDDKTRNIGMPIWDDVYGEWRVFYEYWDYDPDTGDGHWASDMAVLSGDINATILYFSQYWWFTRDRITRNALGLARLVDLPPLTNGLASATSVSAANTRASNAQNMAVAASNTAASVAGTVAAWETYWDGDEVRVTVTNYDSAVHLPSLYIEQKLENTNAYRTVWDERTRWASNDVQMAEMRSAIDEKADRAWGFYDSHTGNYAPDGYTWLSSPRIAIAGGLAYQRTLTTYGAVWVLASNGLVAETNGDADTGYFRIKDDEGNTTFEIVRGNKRTVGATAAGIKVTSPRNSPTTTIEIPYNVTSDVPPTLYGTVSLSSPEWAEISATWTGQSGAWTGTVASSTSTYFIKGTYEVGGETYIKNVAPISVESGIYCTDGIHKVRPVYTNGTITWEVVQ